MPEYKWHPIEPLSDAERAIDLAGARALYDSWHQVQTRLRESNPEGLAQFTERLSRRLSVETGILERVYDLDRGTTETLVTQGFAEDLVTHSSTDIEPGRLIDILRDQDSATQLVVDCVSGARPLTISVVNELHSILMRHLSTTTAVDQFGTRFQATLLKGQFKDLPNNPQQSDGTIHEYCPPAQVASEMENLVTWFNSYSGEDPIIVAAWLHHRFTQIHPYQDGNGRVARALTTLVLLCANLLPLVIDRGLRVEYINALESADFGNLRPLAALFARLEQDAILSALSIEVEAEVQQEQILSSAVMATLLAKFDRRKQAKRAELLAVNNVALLLRARSRQVTESVFNELAVVLRQVGTPEMHIHNGGPDMGNAYWYRSEVNKAAAEAGKTANFEEAHYFIKATLKVGLERLVFVTSFHHVGKELSGIMEATAFAQLESFEDADDRDCITHDFFMCSLQPFAFTRETDESVIADSFDQWMDAAIAVAIKEFGDRL